MEFNFNDRSHVQPYPKNRKAKIDPPNIMQLLNARELGIGRRTLHQFKQFVDTKTTVCELRETSCHLPDSVRTTFLMTFSHDCSKMASAHGDHNIYVSDVKTGKLIRTLEGHPRTPWSIAFHPTSNDILASGCLGGEVRVWDLHGKSTTWNVEDHQVIASLAFHPSLQMLAIAAGNCIYFWNWNEPRPLAFCSTYSEIEKVRYVKYDLYGRLLTGIANATSTGSPKAWGFRCLDTTNMSNQNYSIPATNEAEERNLRERRSGIPPYGINMVTESSSNPDSESASTSMSQATGISKSNVKGRSISKKKATSMPITRPPVAQAKGAASMRGKGKSVTKTPSRINQQQNEQGLNNVAEREIFRMLDRLLTICSELQRHLIRQSEHHQHARVVHVQQNSNNSHGNNQKDQNSCQRNADTVIQDSVSNPWEDLLAALAKTQAILRSILSLSEVQAQIGQIRVSVNELIQRLRHLAGRRLVGQLLQQGLFEEVILQLFYQIENLVQAVNRTRENMMPSSVDQSFTASRSSFVQLPLEPTPPPPSPEENLLLPGPSRPSVRGRNLWTLPDWPIRIEVPPNNMSQAASFSNSGTSVSNASEDNSQSTSFTQSQGQEHLPRHRFNPITHARNFRRNLTFQFSRSNSAQQTSTVRHRIHYETDEPSDSDEEHVFIRNIRSAPRLSLASRRRNASSPAISYSHQNYDLPGGGYSTAEPFWVGPSRTLLNELVSYSGIHRGRPITPPMTIMLQPASLINNGHMAIISDYAARNHRIQIWDFSLYDLPPIYDADANVVVPSCMIHNDASVDISQDGEKLVCLIPPEEGNNLMFGVFSLNPKDIGRILCVWGYVANAISVSFSPLSQYVLIGAAYSKPPLQNAIRTNIAMIVKLKCRNGHYDAGCVRSFSQMVDNTYRFPTLSINCIRWIPEPGFGFAYATNRGILSIWKPSSAWIFENRENDHQD